MCKHVHWRMFLGMLAAMALLCPNSIRAQDRAGILQGVVKNSSGAPMSGAFVKLNNAERRLTFMVGTQVQGRYTASSLPAGKYVVQAIGGDYQSELSAP
ncbi:MAG: carboxypeptidase-like regulatory domain-containing protein, partial [Candidatus Binatia bacterium]